MTQMLIAKIAESGGEEYASTLMVLASLNLVAVTAVCVVVVKARRHLFASPSHCTVLHLHYPNANRWFPRTSSESCHWSRPVYAVQYQYQQQRPTVTIGSRLRVGKCVTKLLRNR